MEECKAESERKWKSLDEHSEGVDKTGSVASGDCRGYDSLLFLRDGSSYIARTRYNFE